ncbi:VOC family protein [Rhodanobacter sp. DHB23]|uniref:VOC family protein n=1 Tax=Rhodanobacter sp. DHB23 TaxID=2775923 RepID=UPI00178557EE|nr:VOC family protein [Rhodanobacter sp. DHB23]MBD8872349.1 VOC family protein [Rhodanobacter sp. DHB23]
MRASPHLTFDGQCRAAFPAYQRILGGEITTMLTYGESALSSQVDAQWHGRIVHATLVVDDIELTGVDMLPPNYVRPQGFFVTLTFDALDKARVVFKALSEQGEVHLPFGGTFWSPGFGVVTDRFGTPWEINTAS